MSDAVTETEAVGLREYVALGEAEAHLEPDGDALTVTVTDAERHSVGELDTDDDVEAQTVSVLLVDGEPVPLLEFAPVDDADTDVEDDKEPLVEGEVVDVRQPEGDNVGESDEELQ